MPKTNSALASNLKFAKDEFGKEVLLKDNSTPVMMEWEKPYVQACIDALHPKDADVLEIGFALGYAADQIQKHHPKSHTIIESDPAVIAKAKEWASKQKSKINIIEGKWQEILTKQGKFDAIFLNDYIPFEREEIRQLIQDNEKCQEAVKEAKSVREALAENLKHWEGLKFSDEEIRSFGKQILSKVGVTMRDVFDFMEYLEEMGHINAKQKNAFEKEFNEEASKRFIPKGSSARSDHSMNKAFLGDRFLAFVESCLDWHMRPDARLSAYVGDPHSKKEDKNFQNRVLSRKGVKYSEKAMAVSVPANCHYFHGKEALVILIEKK